MYKTHVTENTKNIVSTPEKQYERVTNPLQESVILHELPQANNDFQSRIINNLMFWSLGAVAIMLFYKALTSLLL